ncbi:hypothetical protein DY000_02042357 [Brassica cretica]|uniref:HTH myb-type domain-containing protein n=1 Tax=Brassica cretica TaxID=69181 RepID=A0ABQ7BJ15_BRACR|nr:hypothetical protein DY000_02042357 [Brassica cretica]
MTRRCSHCNHNGHNLRIKGTTWTEEEHRRFLLGLQKLGKGDWRGISRKYVRTRTPTQVASHAQKYFMKQSNVSTLHDMIPDHEGGDIPRWKQKWKVVILFIRHLLVVLPSMHHPSSKSKNLNTQTLPVLYQAYLSPHYPFPLSVWTSGYVREPRKKEENHEILIPTAVHSKAPINVDDLFGMTTKLSPGEPKEMENPICLFR